jgi:hypothetical protein
MIALLNTYGYSISNNKAIYILYSSHTIYINVLILKVTQILSRNRKISSELQA